MKENKKSKKEIFESIKKLNVSIDDLLNKKNKSKIETEKQEIDTEVLELRNRLNSLKKEHANSINNFSQRLTSLDNPHEVKLVKFKSSMLKFSVLYNEEYRFRKILITILLATFVSIATIFFIKNSGLFSAGISGVLQGVARLVNNSLLDSGVVTPEVADIIFNVLFWGLTAVINIPLVIFAYKKISKQFAIITIIYILWTQLFGLGLSLIPGIDDIFIFGQVQSEVPSFIGLEDKGLTFLTWEPVDVAKVVSLTMYSVFSLMLIGFPISILYILNGSTGGTDIVSLYFSKKKNKEIGKTLIYFNITFLMISTTLGIFIPILTSPGIQDFLANTKNAHVVSLFFSPNLIISLATTIISSLIIDAIFPKHKKIKIQVYTNKENILNIRNHFIDGNYHYSLTINNAIGGYSLMKKQNIEIICNYIELSKIISEIRKIDEDALISTTIIDDFDGGLRVIN